MEAQAPAARWPMKVQEIGFEPMNHEGLAPQASAVGQAWQLVRMLCRPEGRHALGPGPPDKRNGCRSKREERDLNSHAHEGTALAGPRNTGLCDPRSVARDLGVPFNDYGGPSVRPGRAGPAGRAGCRRAD